SDACLEAGRCKIEDDMQMVYRELEDADRIVLASPIQFMGVTAQMKAMIDRCQALWARKYLLKLPPLDNKMSYLKKRMSFGAKSDSDVITLSKEHTEYRWVSYEDAMAMLKWDSNKNALWELNAR
ncbi:unnamed protein product, partial [marine sediment metagenome]